MKQLLYLSPTIPSPQGIGVQRRAWAHLECLAVLGQVHLVVLLTAAQRRAQGGEDGLGPARARCVNAHIVQIQPLRAPPLTPRLLQLPWQRLRRFGQPDFGLEPGGAADLLRAALTEHHFDLRFFFRTLTFATLYPYIAPGGSSAPLVLDFDDVESVSRMRELRFSRRQLGLEASLAKSIEIAEQWWWERRALGHAAAVAVCSTLDAARLRARGGKADVLVIPNTVAFRTPLPAPAGAAHIKLLLVGAMNYEPNEDAAIFFAQQVLPALRAQLNGRLQVMVVGRAPRQAVLDLQRDPCITVHADVPSVEAYYAQADIVIAPIRFGGGTRVKIIEALAMGRPVVSTRIGAEGLDLTDGEHLLLADTADAFASACCRLASDDKLRTRLAEAGRQVFLERYEDVEVRQRVAGWIRQQMEP